MNSIDITNFKDEKAIHKFILDYMYIESLKVCAEIQDIPYNYTMDTLDKVDNLRKKLHAISNLSINYSKIFIHKNFEYELSDECSN